MKLFLNQFHLNEESHINFQYLAEIFHKNPKLDLIVSPEVFTSGFKYNELEQVADQNKEHIHALVNLCKKYKTGFCGTFLWKDGSRFYNRAFFINEIGDIAAQYDKMHLIPAFREDEFLTPGKKSQMVKYKGLFMGLAVCYDLRFPELFRKYAKLEADAVIVMAQWPQSRKEHMVTLAKARAIENQCYIILVNAVGKTGKIQMAGNSMVIHPKGDVILNLGSATEGRESQIHISEIIKWREEFPALYQYTRPHQFSGKSSILPTLER